MSGDTFIGRRRRTLECSSTSISTFFAVKICQECASLSEWQSIEVESSTDPDKSYAVVLPPWDRTESEAVCECPSFEFRGRCRHQHEAMTMVCQWTELDGQPQTVEQKKSHTCPECGGKTRTVVLND